MARPPHQATPENRKLIEAGAGWGVPLETLALHLGITLKTLHRRYKREIVDGRARAQLKVAKTMFHMATEMHDVGALKWWTATQMKWSPAPSQVEVYSPADKPLVIQDDREDSLAAYFRSQEAAPRALLSGNGAGLERHRQNGEEPPGDAGPREG